ncbi:MAG: carboxymuconolactone decarboxylase family protein [Candidatus Heimdallarchaeaceae archaeon]
MEDLKAYKKYREEMNKKIFELKNKQINRFFSLDTSTYFEGALPVKIKELMGLATSTVLRCEDCIKYHLIRAIQEGCSDDEIVETLSISLIVGGSIVIPELRRAVDTLVALREMENKGEKIDDLL